METSVLKCFRVKTVHSEINNFAYLSQVLVAQQHVSFHFIPNNIPENN